MKNKLNLRLKIIYGREYLKQIKFFVLRINLKQNILYLKQIKKNGKGTLWIIFDYLSLLKKGFITFSEYYKYEFDKQDTVFRNSFLGSVNSNKYYRLLNPSDSKNIAKNKFITHCVLGTIGIPKAKLLLYYNPNIKNNNNIITCDYINAAKILKAQNVEDFVVKPASGLLGKDIFYFNQLEYLSDNILLHSSNGVTIYLSDLLKHEHLIFESHVKQSKQFSEFNPSSVNCLRFMTSLDPGGEVEIIGITIKVGRKNSFVDNASQGGNINAAIDLLNGKIYNVYQFDGFRKIQPITHHPDTKTLLDGVIIKNWENIKAGVISFHKSIPYLKVIGWDIAITESGPKVIELNCEAAITPQLFIGKGWKDEIKDSYRKWLDYKLKA